MIPELIFDILNFSKKTGIVLKSFALEYKKGEVNKIKALSYNTIIYIWHHRVSLSYDLATFQILGQKFVKFFVGILVKKMTPKREILKLTDLYLIYKLYLSSSFGFWTCPLLRCSWMTHALKQQLLMIQAS